MNENPAVDYQSALEQFRKIEHMPDNAVRSPDRDTSLPFIDGFVDYEAVSKDWDRDQLGQYKIYLHARKRNPSHDPERY